MEENSKKRTGSFRKLFPSLFSSHKSKEKNAQTNLKSSKDYTVNNQYQNPRSVIKSDPTECIYENLTLQTQNDNDSQSIDISSNHSSSSTLVSESIKNTIPKSDNQQGGYSRYTARPQVPPKPYNEMINQGYELDTSQYPNVYYHSLEKLTNKILPLDNEEIYKASQTQANPASVGAEIKRVSTKFLISPKKEAEVRTIQPTRARSLSFNNNEEKMNTVYNVKRDSKQANVKKAYNYSAPTSPIPINHRIPNMPKTVSPYEQVRKAMIETEVKRNTLSRGGVRITSTPSPRLDEYNDRSKTPTPTPTIHKEIPKHEETDKEKTRQKVEAFYWQKLKELKQKEDEYFLRQSLKGSPVQNTFSNSNCSSPNSLIKEPRRSSSLPRGKDLTSYVDQPIYSQMPFKRGAPERRTDTFITSRSSPDSGTIYRNPKKLNFETASPASLQDRKLPIFYRGSLTQDYRGIYQTKRVSFEGQFKNIDKNINSSDDLKVNDVFKLGNRTEYFLNKGSDETTGSAPRPPVRTTSVASPGKSFKTLNNKNIAYLYGGHSVCSESESGSEAGEIQRILQRKEEDWHDGSRIDGGHSDGEASRGPLRPRASRRDDPRRHTLAGNNVYTHANHPSQISIEMEKNLREPREVPPVEFLFMKKKSNLREPREVEFLFMKKKQPAPPFVIPRRNMGNRYEMKATAKYDTSPNDNSKYMENSDELKATPKENTASSSNSNPMESRYKLKIPPLYKTANIANSENMEKPDQLKVTPIYKTANFANSKNMEKPDQLKGTPKQNTASSSNSNDMESRYKVKATDKYTASSADPKNTEKIDQLKAKKVEFESIPSTSSFNATPASTPQQPVHFSSSTSSFSDYDGQFTKYRPDTPIHPPSYPGPFCYSSPNTVDDSFQRMRKHEVPSRSSYMPDSRPTSASEWCNYTSYARQNNIYEEVCYELAQMQNRGCHHRSLPLTPHEKTVWMCLTEPHFLSILIRNRLDEIHLDVPSFNRSRDRSYRAAQYRAAKKIRCETANILNRINALARESPI